MAQERWQVNDSELSAATSSSSSSASKSRIPCINNCGFFGTAAQMNYCSACYRKISIYKADQTSSSMATAGTLDLSSFSPPPPPVEGSMGAAVTLENEGLTTPFLKNGENETLTITKSPPSRCQSCRKRLGLSGFKCRCGDLFCPLHRYSDKHNCTFDYKAAARTQISRSNPLVVAAKITKI